MPPPVQPAWQGYGKPGVIPLRPLALGEILDGAITTMRRHAGLVLGMSAAVAVLAGVVNIAATAAMMDDLSALAALDTGELSGDDLLSALTATIFTSMISVVVTVLGTTFLTGFLMIVVGRAVLGQPIDLGTALQELKPRLLPLLGLTLLVTLIVILGILACIVPGVWLYVGLALAPPVLMLEKTTVSGSMSRSWELVKGNWWRIFGILLLTALLVTVVSMLIGVPFALLGGGFSTFTGEFTELTFSGLLAQTTGDVLAMTVTTPFAAIVSALIYVDQRMRREGMDISLAREAGLGPHE